MIALAVYLNGKKLTVAGAEDLSVLNAIVSAVGTLGASTALLVETKSLDMHLTVGGLTNRRGGVQDEHLRWIRLRRLKVGDRISVRIVRSTRPDKPSGASPAVSNERKVNELKRGMQRKQRSRLKQRQALRKT